MSHATTDSFVALQGNALRENINFYSLWEHLKQYNGNEFQFCNDNDN